MKISSPAFQHREVVPQKYTCDGENINPPLAFEDVPEDAQTLVLIMDDPDAPVGVWDHWLVYNIDPQTTDVEEDSVPDGALEGKNDFKKNSYGGPCPPTGPAHRYTFSLYALDTKIDLPEGATKSELEMTMETHIIAKAQLIGLYQR